MLDITQETAVHHGSGPCLTIAGPGSGKTTVLTHRICNLITEYEVDPSNILVITFTKDAAKEMKARFLKLYGSEGSAVTVATFHSAFFQILKEHYNLTSKNILSGKTKTNLLKEALYQCKIKALFDDEFFKSLEKDISFLQNSAADVSNYEASSLPAEQFRAFYLEYVSRKKKNSFVDFDDMMSLTYELFKSDEVLLQKYRDKYKYLLIDEMQDMNELQFNIVKLLAFPLNNIFAVGDDDQSIYGFRGSDPSIMMNFPEYYKECKVIKLTKNYRCKKSIVESSARLIANNKNRFDKELVAHNTEEGRIRYKELTNPAEEAEYIANLILADMENGCLKKTVAVLYRTNSQAVDIVRELEKRGIPYNATAKKDSIYKHAIMRDIKAYLLMATGDMKRENVLLIANKPNRYISRDSINDEIIDFDKWIEYYSAQPWMQDHVLSLKKGLMMIKNWKPFMAINYIRKGMGYDLYLKESSYGNNNRLNENMSVLDEVQKISSEFRTIKEFLAEVEYRGELEDTSEQNKTASNAVALHTFHGSKGLEFDAVHILDVNEGVTPSRNAGSLATVEEERRMFYVALTRAKSELYLYSIKERFNEKLYPSRYLSEISDTTSS